MSSLTHAARRIAFSPSVVRSVAIAALFGTAFLASPLTAARADGAATAPSQIAQSVMRVAAADPAAAPAATKAATVEDRIANLHTSLQITPAQESKWKFVAKVMRENAAAMDALTADKSVQNGKDLTAVQDLKAYEKFAQAHLDGLKHLVAAFDSLYKSMPAAQQKIADQVFQTFGHDGGHAHS